MADDHRPSNEIGEAGEAGEGGEGVDGGDYDDASSASPVHGEDVPTPPAAPAVDPNAAADAAIADYDGPEEPIADFVANMVVNEDGATIPPPLLDAIVTDSYGNPVTGQALVDSLNSVTTGLYDELNGNGTGIAGGKRWWGWSTKKILFTALIALCILGIILAILFLVLKKLKKNKKPAATSGTSTTAQAAVNKNISPNPKYQQVPTV